MRSLKVLNIGEARLPFGRVPARERLVGTGGATSRCNLLAGISLRLSSAPTGDYLSKFRTVHAKNSAGSPIQTV